MKNCLLLFVCALSLSLCACVAGQQRGMAGASYVSTSKPAFCMGVADSLPLIAGGRGIARLDEIPGGVQVDTWVALYGNLQQGPVAVIAHAQLPNDAWYWNNEMPGSQCIDCGTEVIGDKAYDAWTHIVSDRRNPFVADGADQRWLVRTMTRRDNFDIDKIILEYRERLPEGVQSLTNLPVGGADMTKAFAERARKAFVPAPAVDRGRIACGPVAGVRWRYVDSNFLGAVSRRVFNCN